MVKVEWNDGGEIRQTNFRRELLTKLQSEFESTMKNDEEVKRLTKAVEEAATLEERKQYEDELKEIVSKTQQRSIPIISFIGELFKLSMLSQTIIHECIAQLLELNSASDEEHLECFARLITVTGKELDHPTAKVTSFLMIY